MALTLVILKGRAMDATTKKLLRGNCDLTARMNTEGIERNTGSREDCIKPRELLLHNIGRYCGARAKRYRKKTIQHAEECPECFDYYYRNQEQIANDSVIYGMEHFFNLPNRAMDYLRERGLVSEPVATWCTSPVEDLIAQHRARKAERRRS